MRLPRPRNLVGAIVIILMFVAIGLVIAQDQETLRIRTPLAAGRSALSRLPRDAARRSADVRRRLHRPYQRRPGVSRHARGDRRGAAPRRFETYIFDAGEIAERFTTALEAAARRGVECRMVLDSVGASDDGRRHIERLEQAGCRIGWFNPVASFAHRGGELPHAPEGAGRRRRCRLRRRHRHRGPVGVRHGEDAPQWRDTHFEVHGPAAINVEAAFHENWIETGGVVEPDLLLHAEPTGKAQSIVVWSSPEGGANETEAALPAGDRGGAEDARHPVAVPDHRRIDAVEPQRGAAARRPRSGC